MAHYAVTVAVEPNKDVKENVEELLKSKFNFSKNDQVEYIVDPNIIGGVSIVVDESTKYDATVASKLQRLQA